MRCSGCGATLEIKPDIEVFACAYCGTNQRVERGGGTITLRAIDKKLDNVRQGVDRTAAELALPRLVREIRQVEADRQRRLHAAANDPANASGAMLAVSFVLVAIAAFIWWKLTFGWALFPLLLGLVVGQAGAHLGKPEAEKRINDECDRKAQRLKAQLDANRRILNADS